LTLRDIHSAIVVRNENNETSYSYVEFVVIKTDWLNKVNWLKILYVTL